MCEITIKVKCAYCPSSKVVKNGKKTNGTQNFLCRDCNKQFQLSYKNKGADPAIQDMIIRMLERNSGIRDIESVLEVSRGCVLNALCKHGKLAEITPVLKHYKSIQIDEVWSYVGRKKKGKYWLIDAYSKEDDQILAYACGSRSSYTVGKLMKKLEGIEIDEICTDNWRAFSEVIPKHLHKVGKQHTKNIEGVNTALRARNRRLVRRTTCFSKKKLNHDYSINIMFRYRNKQKYKHHTF